MLGWVKHQMTNGAEGVASQTEKIFRCVCRAGKSVGEHISEQTVWHDVKTFAA